VRARRIVFVASAADAPPSRPDTTVIVLDTAWTPAPGSRPDVESALPRVSAVLRDVDLFHAALDRLDRWAAGAGLVDGLVVDDVAWWFRLRPFLVDYLHERMLWGHLIARLVTDEVEEIHVPEAEAPLLDVLRSRCSGGKPALTVAEGPPGGLTPASPRPSIRERVRDRIPPWRRRIERQARRSRSRRSATLDDRVARICGAGGCVIAITQPRIHQVVQTGAGDRRVDPQLAPIIDRLESLGSLVVSLGLEVDHRRDADWPMIAADPTLLPQSLLATRWGTDADRELPRAALDPVLSTARATPCVVAGTDLAPAVVHELERYCGPWLTSQRLTIRRAGRAIDEIRPSAFLVNHEGIRTPWLAAARLANVPVFAVQHGLIYPRHAVYSHPRHLHLPYADRTFTYGDYERRVLVRHGGYRDEEVVAVGSPRGVNAAADDPAAIRRPKPEVRRRLGIADDATLLVVSTAHTAVHRRFHLAHMIASLLGGPLPGVHVVFKLHPGEVDEGPYRRLVEGLARAAGHAAPPMTVVKDIDLYQLLEAADAHLGLHSTVLTDAVVAGTPNLISVAEAYRDLLGYVEAGVAAPVASAPDLRRALSRPPRPDPTARRLFLNDHFAPGDAAMSMALAIRRAGLPEAELVAEER
jgi:glycosyltransferase involved in cell wall biosynthesis